MMLNIQADKALQNCLARIATLTYLIGNLHQLLSFTVWLISASHVTESWIKAYNVNGSFGINSFLKIFWQQRACQLLFTDAVSLQVEKLHCKQAIESSAEEGYF